MSNPALMKLHGDLQTKLLTGIISNDRNSDSFAEWKTAFETQISTLPAQKTCSVLENFNFLNRKGLYGVGKYQVLMGLFEGNDVALSAINYTLERMAEKLDARGYDTSKLCEYIFGQYLNCSVSKRFFYRLMFQYTTKHNTSNGFRIAKGLE